MPELSLTLLNVRRSGSPVNTKHLYNICTMLDQRRRRWADVVQMLYEYVVYPGGLIAGPASHCCLIVGPASQMLDQH